MEPLFKCLVEVPRHSSKKNEKEPRYNRGTGRFFVGKTSRAKFCEDWLIKKLLVEKIKQQIDEPITCDIKLTLKFFFPETVYYTRKGERSKRLPDLSNLIELPQDILQHKNVKIIENDTQVESLDGSGRFPLTGTKYLLSIEIYKLT